MNKTKKQLKAMSSYDLDERLDALRDIEEILYKYRHVFDVEDNKEKLSAMVEIEIGMTIDILEERIEY
jgi:hypothetical protein